jgi:oligosaccharide repeat unit polymerase
MMNSRVSHLAAISLVNAAYFSAFSYLFVTGIFPIYEYMGFRLNINIYNIGFSLIILFVMMYLINQKNFIIDFFYTLMMGLILVPTLVLFSVGDGSFYNVMVTSAAMLCVFACAKFIRIPRLSIFQIPFKIMLPFSIIISICAIGFTIVLQGLGTINFDLSAVYQFRRESANLLPGAFAYLNSIVGKVILPFGFLLALHRRRYFLVVLFFLLSILMFGVTAHKSPLLYPVVVAFVYVMSAKKNFLLSVYLSLLAVVLIGILDIFLMTNDGNFIFGWFTSLLPRRVLLVPAYLNSLYLDYFNGSNFFFWANSKITFGLIENSFEDSFSKVIGAEYFDSDDMSANTGWIGSGYANAGIFGVLLYSIVIGFLLGWLKNYSTKYGHQFIAAAFSIPFLIIFTSSDLVTMFLSHGLLISFILLMMLDWRDFELNDRLL